MLLQNSESSRRLAVSIPEASVARNSVRIDALPCIFHSPRRLTTPNKAARILIAAELHHKRLMEISVKMAGRLELP
jgi:hypothetical protein